jgi:hypothetical protein
MADLIRTPNDFQHVTVKAFRETAKIDDTRHPLPSEIKLRKDERQPLELHSQGRQTEEALTSAGHRRILGVLPQRIARRSSVEYASSTKNGSVYSCQAQDLTFHTKKSALLHRLYWPHPNFRVQSFCSMDSARRHLKGNTRWKDVIW